MARSQIESSTGHRLVDGKPATDRRVSGVGTRRARREDGRVEHVPQPLLTVDETAAWLKIPKATLYRQNSNGVPPGALGIRIGRWLRYEIDTVQRWLDEAELS
jgi:hypothetical protein